MRDFGSSPDDDADLGRLPLSDFALADLGSRMPARLSPHSFRVAVITDLLDQGVPLEDLQQLAGDADPRTARLYDRRQRNVTRNIVERIRFSDMSNDSPQVKNPHEEYDIE
jgi:integrase